MPRTVPSYVINAVTAADFDRLEITKNESGGLQCTGFYKVTTNPANAPSPDQRAHSVGHNLTTAQANAIVAYVNAALVPAANSIEGT